MYDDSENFNEHGEFIDKIRKNILNEDDSYGNGYIGHDSIEIEIVDGKAILSKPLRFHAGQ